MERGENSIMTRAVPKEQSIGGNLQQFGTPSWCTEALLDHQISPGSHITDLLQGRRWLEPAAGRGNIITAVNTWRAKWLDADPLVWMAVEIDANEGKHLGVQWRDDDFITSWAPAVHSRCHGSASLTVRKPFDVAITNPPYSLALDFAMWMRCLATWTVLGPLSAMIWETGKKNHRYNALSQHMPLYELALSSRPSFRANKLGKRATDATPYVWLIWGPGDGKDYTIKQVMQPISQKTRLESEAQCRELYK